MHPLVPNLVNMNLLKPKACKYMLQFNVACVEPRQLRKRLLKAQIPDNLSPESLLPPRPANYPQVSYSPRKVSTGHSWALHNSFVK